MSKSQTTIVCPSCQTYFHIPSSSLGPKGRTVRCTVCQKQWFEKTRRSPEIAPLTSAEKLAKSGKPLRNIERLAHIPDNENITLYKPFPENIRQEHQEAKKDLPIKIILAVTALLGICGAILCMQVFSSTPNISSFKVLSPTWQTKHTSAGIELSISGSVANIADKTLPPPPVCASIRIAEGQKTSTIAHTIPIKKSPIPPSAMLAFQHNITLPQSTLVHNVDLQIE